MLPAQDSQLDVQASLKRLQVADSILDCVGNTPLVRIKSQGRWPADVVVLAKLEAFNPGGSVKDRPALSIVRGGLARGVGRTIAGGSNRPIITGRLIRLGGETSDNVTMINASKKCPAPDSTKLRPIALASPMR